MYIIIVKYHKLDWKLGVWERSVISKAADDRDDLQTFMAICCCHLRTFIAALTRNFSEHCLALAEQLITYFSWGDAWSKRSRTFPWSPLPPRKGAECTCDSLINQQFVLLLLFPKGYTGPLFHGKTLRVWDQRFVFIQAPCLISNLAIHGIFKLDIYIPLAISVKNTVWL